MEQGNFYFYYNGDVAQSDSAPAEDSPSSRSVLRIRLGELMKQSGISQADLHRATGINRVSIGKMIDNTAIKLDVNDLARLCKVLNVGLHDLLVLEEGV